MMRRNKYNAKKTYVDGIKFDSGDEAARYCELKLLLKAGMISDLELQPRFDIIINGVKVCFYKADFRYIEKGKSITEDVKGSRKGQAYQMFRLKAKLVKACHGVDIVEVYMKKKEPARS